MPHSLKPNSKAVQKIMDKTKDTLPDANTYIGQLPRKKRIQSAIRTFKKQLKEKFPGLEYDVRLSKDDDGKSALVTLQVTVIGNSDLSQTEYWPL